MNKSKQDLQFKLKSIVPGLELSSHFEIIIYEKFSSIVKCYLRAFSLFQVSNMSAEGKIYLYPWQLIYR